ncbi:MAG TPA: ABC transporter permease [Spirochaetia bacterium]|nr:ABC transporter permease [Spirochaetia bacterium]
MQRTGAIFREQWFFLLLVEAALAIVTGLMNPRFFGLNNIENILEQVSVLGLVAAGATLLMISGNFDISVGANIGISACVMAILMKAGYGYVPSVIVGILLATFNAFFVGASSILFKAPSFIISLACIGIFRGIALAFTKGVLQLIYGKFEFLGTKRFFNIIPLLFVISIAGYLIIHFILKYMKLGRRAFAIGSNVQASYLAGIPINLNKLVFFIINGLLVGTAATLLLSRIGAAQPSTGSGIELQAIGAVVIGGTPMTGGRGKIIGTFFGVLLTGIISNALNMLQVNPYFQDVAIGALIIVSLAVSAFSQRGQRA